LKKELFIFIVIFLFLSVGMHFEEWINIPLVHLQALPDSNSYGFGWEHPFIYTFAVYIVLYILRLPFRKRR